METRTFGRTAEGKEASLYTIANHAGMRVLVTDFGATVVSVFVKDKNGKDTDVIFGYDNVEEYQNGMSYFGATVGRNCNRISDAKITIDGVEYLLDNNDRGNNLHSGPNGVSKRMWNVKEHSESSITFQIEDADRQQGFPGNADIQVTFAVTEKNELAISYHAVADKKTVFNFTNHSYFNLNGVGNGTAMEHILQIQASHYTPVQDARAIPTGELAPVEGTPFDFREPKPIGRDVDEKHEQLGYGNGYDHNLALDRKTSGVEKVATVYSQKSGIQMDVYTDCVGLQLYSANFAPAQTGKGGKTYNGRDAFCLETQYFPNAVNEPDFITPLTPAGEAYESQTIYAFSIV